MVLAYGNDVDFGHKASDFRLLGTDGEHHTLGELKGENATLVMFICNHCPYVMSILDKLCKECREMKALGIASVAIMPNDVAKYPQDSFDNMVKLHRDKNFPFPYLIDENHQTAQAYKAVCTPDFFGFNADLLLQYRGRFDNSGTVLQTDMKSESELFKAMKQIADTGLGAKDQNPSEGCSIKW